MTTLFRVSGLLGSRGRDSSGLVVVGDGQVGPMGSISNPEGRNPEIPASLAPAQIARRRNATLRQPGAEVVETSTLAATTNVSNAYGKASVHLRCVLARLEAA